MNPEAIKDIIRQLRQKGSEAMTADDDDLADSLIAARKALAEWDGNGPVPYATELRRWGIDLPGQMDEAKADDALPDDDLSGQLTDDLRDMPVHAASAVMAEADESASAAPLDNPFDLPEHFSDDAPTVEPPTSALLPDAEPEAEPSAPASDDNADRDDTPRSARRSTATQPEAMPSPPPTEPEAPAWDPDDDLQQAFDTAQAYLNNGRYRAALDAFDDLRVRATGRLDQPSEAGYETAATRLAEQLRPHVERAQRHADKQPEDFKGQRQLWRRVLEIDSQHETANRAVRELDEREAAREIDRRVSDIRERLEFALRDSDYPTITALLGEAEGLASGNQLTARQRELDLLVNDVKDGRAKMRDYLGQASTKAQSDDFKGAYQQARIYIDQKVPVAIDERGVFGPVDQAYDTVDFLRLARQNFIDWSRRKALERKGEAASEAPAAPERALRTLAEARAFLTDDALTRDDRELLASTLREIEKDEAEVNERLDFFRRAEELVNKAQLETPRERLRLLREGRAVYKEFPDIDGRIARAQNDVAAVVAGELENRLVAVRQLRVAEKFDEALAALAAAREDATNQVPDFAPDSKLAEGLTAVSRLEDEIIRSQDAHNRLVSELAEIDALLQRKEADKARQKLKELTEEEQRHRETQKRYHRLGEVQDVRESWPQAGEEYATGRWTAAIPLLERVAGSAMEEKSRAALLLNRARAAQAVEEALKDEENKNWREALNKFRRALEIFNRYPTDDLRDPAEPLRRRAEDRRADLDKLDENDQLVQGVVKQTEGLLQTAIERADARQSAEAQAEPIGLFAAAAVTLTGLLNKNLRTTRISELENQIYLVRSHWRNTYLKGLRAAMDLRDEALLRRALYLGRTLEANGLLIEQRDKDVYREAQETFLDLELERLRRRPPQTEDLRVQLAATEQAVSSLSDEERRDPERVALLTGEASRLRRELELLQIEPIHATALIAENRRERWRVADSDRETLEKEYKDAVRARVRHQLAAKRHDGLKPALDFLAAEVDTPELYEDEAFFAELMELCWQAGERREAHRRASELASRANLADAGLKSDMWLGLIAMAGYLNDGDRDRFEAEWETVRKPVNDRPEYLTFLNQQRQKQIDWRVRTLLDRAERGAAGARPAEWIDALLAYAEADAWARGNAKVSAGLTALGSRLNTELDTRLPAALTFSLAGGLSDNLRAGEEQLRILTTIHAQADLLRLERDRKEELASAIETLEKKLEPGRKVQTSLIQADSALEEALVNPQPFQGDEGGWSFDRAKKLLEQAQLDARKGDRALQGQVQTRLDRLEELADRADTLNELVRDFRRAVADEEFDAVINAVGRLEPEWRVRQQADGFRGLEQLTRINYALDKRSPRTLGDHAKVAASQKENYAEWQAWAERCQRAYDELQPLGDKLKVERKKLAHEKTLAEIGDDCDRARRHFGAFANAYAQRPPRPTLSRKALAAADGIDHAKFTTAEAYDRRAAELRREVDDTLHALNSGPLHKLRGAMDQLEKARRLVGTKPGFFSPVITTIPKARFDTARALLDEVSSLDPRNLELGRLRAKYEAIKSGPGGLPE